MIYHKICALETCKKQFKTTMKRKKYHSSSCYKIINKNHAQNRQNELTRQKQARTESAEKFPCLKCGLKRNTEKWRFCISCREDIRQFDITDTLAMEHRIIG